MDGDVIDDRREKSSKPILEMGVILNSYQERGMEKSVRRGPGDNIRKKYGNSMANFRGLLVGASGGRGGKPGSQLDRKRICHERQKKAINHGGANPAVKGRASRRSNKTP